MPALLQICLLVVTLAFVAVAIATIRAMSSFEKAAKEISETSESARETIGQVQRTAQEIRTLGGTFESFLPRFRSMWRRFEDVGVRTADLSRTVIEEVEAPARTAVAMASGFRTVTARFFRTMASRPPRHRTPTNGGVGHE